MVIVTGANGFIGSAFVGELGRLGIQNVCAVDSVSLTERPQPLRGKAHTVFLDKDDVWPFLVKNAGQIKWVVHLGACSSTTELNRDFLWENNTLYTQRIWQWCARQQVPLIYASSGAVYGDGSQGFDDLSDPEDFKPLNPYGDSKVEFDRWALKQDEQPPYWYGLRFFNVFGPNEYLKGDMASVVFKAFNQIQATGQLRLFRSHHPDYKDGEQKRDFVYVKDILRWMHELMLKKPTSGIYNMGFGQSRTWLDLAGATFKAMNVPQKIDWIDIPVEMRPRYQYYTQAKMDRLMGLGLSLPKWPLEQAVTDYVQNFLLKPDPWL